MRLLSIVVGVVGLVGGMAWGHPQDGPDVDVRVQIRDGGVTMALAFNLSFLDAYGLAPRESPDELHAVEQDAVRALLLDFVRERNSVAIDGVEVAPVLVEWEVPEPDRSLLPLFPLSGMAALARVRMVLEYPAKSEPQSVTIRWGAFPIDTVLSTPEDQRTLLISAQMWAGGVSWVQPLSEEEPSYTWLASDAAEAGRLLEVPPVVVREPVTAPALSAGLIGAWVVLMAGVAALGRGRQRYVVALSLAPVFLVGAAVTTDVGRVDVSRWAGASVALPSEAEAEAIFLPLHTNIYRAFDYTEEEDVYDALAQSVHGDLLASLYERVYAGLVMQLEDGAAVSRVQSVDPIETVVSDVRVRDDGRVAFDVDARWRVTGAVFHWGHSHTRTNEHRALYTVVGFDEGWRIVSDQVLEQFRVESSPGVDPGVWRPGMDL